ncbi:hypothetical protein Tco_0036872 [Tanacetum coccineum]
MVSGARCQVLVMSTVLEYYLRACLMKVLAFIFAYMALPDHDAIVLQSNETNAIKVEECMAATIKIGVSCSMDSPPQQMTIEIVVNELERLSSCLYGKAERNCKKEQCVS